MRDDEGTTFLDVEVVENGDIVVSFGKDGGGARNWPELTDAFSVAIDRLRELELSESVENLDQGRRLGQGGRRQMCRAVFFVVWALWDEEAAVVLAFRRHALRVNGSAASLGSGWMRRARRLLQRQRDLHVMSQREFCAGTPVTQLDEEQP